MKNLDHIHAALSFQTAVRRVCTVCLLAVCGLFAAAPVFAANGEAGRVIALTPGAFVERSGQRIPLEIKSPVLESDTIVTDSTGKAQILFADDGSVTLGPDTTLALKEVAPAGSSASFKAHLGQGVARFLTGKIVEANPRGFAVTTPEGTAGIRGTIFVLQTGNGRTTISVVNASRDVVLNGVSVPGAHKLTLPGGVPVPMTPADMEQARSLAAARPASATAAAQAANLGLASPVDNAGDGNAALTPTALADLGLGTQSLGDSLSVMPTTGTITGSLTTSTLTAAYEWSGGFAFDVNLGSGSISNASMNLAGTLGQDANGGGGSYLSRHS
ncbi:MAG: FecR family protein [Desulfovibrio sp.]|nr:FecR family protein [Desulfovibrio sp.]